jgi:rhodanese-related sulfurtransferase
MRIHQISARLLHDRLQDGSEIALLDAREAADFAKGHINLARHLPLSTLEMEIARAVPRLATPVVLCDGGDARQEGGSSRGIADRAYAVLQRLGYTQIVILRGGVAEWIAHGFQVLEGYATLVRAFADQVRERLEIPTISVSQLHERISAGVPTTIIDVRPLGEYEYAALPTARNYPGVELPTRRLACSEPKHLWVINCFSRTRGVVGTATLRLLMRADNVVYLDDGVMSWYLHGYETTHGAVPANDLPALTDAELAQQADSIMAEWRLASITPSILAQWREDASRTLYLFDVRGLTEDAHSNASVHRVPGGQLLMHYDTHVFVRNARVVLVDDAHRLRAAVTAFWLAQLGDVEVYILKGEALGEEPNLEQPAKDDSRRISVEELGALIATGSCSVVDVSPSVVFEKGHIPGAYFMIASALPALAHLRALPPPLVFVSSDGEAARLAARDAQIEDIRQTHWLRGGTAAWCKAGNSLQTEWLLAQLLTPFMDDWGSVVRLRPDQRQKIYPTFLAWERSLGARIAIDDSVKFKFFDANEAKPDGSD